MMSGERPVPATSEGDTVEKCEGEVIHTPDAAMETETTADTDAVQASTSAEHSQVTVEHEQPQTNYEDEQSQAINNLLGNVGDNTPASDVDVNATDVDVNASTNLEGADNGAAVVTTAAPVSSPATETVSESTAVTTEVRDTGTSTVTETSDSMVNTELEADSTKSDDASMTVSDNTVTTTKVGKDGKPRRRRRRGSAWSDEQTEFLMEIWARHAAEQKEEEETNPNTATPVYRIIAKAMQEQGDTKTWEQCKTRIHTLKRAYKLTKDEIDTGAPNITYCRHFDKLEIIMHDGETKPQSLADLLEARRKSRAEIVNRVKTPQKRKLLTLPNKNAKQSVQNTSFNTPPSSFQQPDMQPMQVDQQQSNTTGTTNDYWMNQSQNHSTYQQISPSPLAQQLNANSGGSTMFTQSQTIPNVSPYSMTNSSVSSETLTPARMPEINNNDISVKTERQDPPQQEQYSISTMTAQTWTTIAQPPAQPPQKEELEKMRLNLELRKIEMERNKLEMAERSRREERDHQYRMLQLLMFGLGQQNSAHSHQGVEQVVAQAQNSTNLSRALENGLVPGGPHTANEKGLSFNEI